MCPVEIAFVCWVGVGGGGSLWYCLQDGKKIKKILERYGIRLGVNPPPSPPEVLLAEQLTKMKDP